MRMRLDNRPRKIPSSPTPPFRGLDGMDKLENDRHVQRVRGGEVGNANAGKSSAVDRVLNLIEKGSLSIADLLLSLDRSI